MNDCRSISKSDIKELKKMMSVFKNPIELFYQSEKNFVANKKEIDSLVTKGSTNYD